MRIARSAVYALYCLLAGSLWIAEAVLAPSWPGLARIAWHDGLVAVVFCALALRIGTKPDWRALLEVGAWCAVLFVGPGLLAEWAGGQVGSGLATLVLGLIPVVTVFVAAQREEDAMGLLLPAAIGTAGLGLVIPFAWPNSLGGGAWLGVMVLLAVGSAIAGVRLHGLLKRVPLAWAGAVGSGFAALAATAVWAGGQRVRMDWDWKTAAIETFWGLIVDGALVWLVLWLLREMRPVAFSGRFLLVPVVTLAGGILLEKPEVGWTGWLGLGLAAGSGLVLIRPSMQGLFR